VVSCRVVLEMVECDKMHVLSILIQCFRSKLPIAIQFWSFYNNRDYIGWDVPVIQLCMSLCQFQSHSRRCFFPSQHTKTL